jgi:uncharacterized protein DUF2867
MRLAKTAHTSRPWRVHELTEDFELEDAWELPTPRGPDDLARLLQQFTSSSEEPVVLRALFALRWELGELFGWDEPGSRVGERVPSLRDRLPADLFEAPPGPDLRVVPGREAMEGPLDQPAMADAGWRNNRAFAASWAAAVAGRFAIPAPRELDIRACHGS